MSKKGGGAGDGKITPKNPSLRMRPRGGFSGWHGVVQKSLFLAISGNAGFEEHNNPREVGVALRKGF